VLREVMTLFPSRYIHIGGDECPKHRWEACPKCQQRMKDESLASEDELQSYFIRRIERFLSAHGRRLIGWDEILEGGLPPNATVQSWRGLRGAVAAARSGHDVICSPTSHCYLDYAQARLPGEPTWMGFIDLERAYAFEPVPAELSEAEAAHVLGVEGNMWTEHAPQERVDWQLYPRLCALAEVMWTPQSRRDLESFQARLASHYERLDALGVAYFIPPPICRPAEQAFAEAIEVHLQKPLAHVELRYTLDGTEPDPTSPRYGGPLNLTETTTLKARGFLADGRGGATLVREFRKRADQARP
jgi:hexosaminidase